MTSTTPENRVGDHRRRGASLLLNDLPPHPRSPGNGNLSFSKNKTGSCVYFSTHMPT